MNRLDRLTAILIMLQSRKILTAKEIADRFEISQRTVYRDMRALDEAGVPIGAEAGRGYYLVDGYHLPPVMFTHEEASSLLIADKLVDKFGDKSVKASFNLAVDKIKSVLPEEHRDFLGQMENQVHVFYTSNKESANFSNDFITRIQQALSEQMCVKISYFSKYKQARTSRVIEPLGLCFYGFQWHLIAFCQVRNDYRDFRLDRIESLEHVECENAHLKNFSITDYFNRIEASEEVFKVSIRFDKEKADAISTARYYFGYFEETVSSEHVEMSFLVSDLNYIAGWLISLGEIVLKVLHAELQDEIIRRVKGLLTHYIHE